MKKIFCIIAFSFSCFLSALETPDVSTNLLMKLEPPYSLQPREINTIDKVVHFCLIPNGGFYEAVTQPFFRASYASVSIAFSRGAIRDNRNVLIQLNWQEYKESLSKTLSTPYYLPMLITSLPTIEYIIMPIINLIFPKNLIHPLFDNNIMTFQARQYCYNLIKSINQDKFINATKSPTTKNSDDLILSNIAFTILSIVSVACANYINPDLYARYTYFEFSNLAFAKGFFLYYLPLLSLQNRPQFTQKIAINTIYGNYSLFTLLKDVNEIFEVKKTTFLISIVLTCLYLKPKNKLFTNPSYWLPIGIAHVLFTKYQCEKKLFNKSKILIKYETLSNRSKRIATFVLYNAVPISAVLINSCASIKD